MDESTQALLEVVVISADFGSDLVEEFCARVAKGCYLRDENEADHFVAHIAPYSKKDREVLFVHHKKANAWIFPGGHIEPGESVLETVAREALEELTLEIPQDYKPEPFCLTKTPIDNQIQKCKLHYDLWFLVDVKKDQLTVNMDEFLAYRWLTLEEAEKLTAVDSVRTALNALKIRLGD